MDASHASAGRSTAARTALIAVAAFALGVLAAALLRALESSAQPAAHGVARGTGELATELASIRTELGRLRQVVESANPTLAGPTGEPRREQAASNAELEAILGRFERALVGLERSASSPPRPALPGQGRPSFPALEGEVEARCREDFDGLCRDLSRAHYLWTVDEVVARYGMPNQREGAGDLNLAYGLGGDDSPEPQRYVSFEVHDGRVTGVYIELE